MTDSDTAGQGTAPAANQPAADPGVVDPAVAEQIASARALAREHGLQATARQLDHDRRKARKQRIVQIVVVVMFLVMLLERGVRGGWFQ